MKNVNVKPQQKNGYKQTDIIICAKKSFSHFIATKTSISPSPRLFHA